MSELKDGARREIVLDEKAFGQKSTQLSKDIGAGGEICGRAFWGNEAIKAATAAFRGG